jgi:hypothetical protein
MKTGVEQATDPLWMWDVDDPEEVQHLLDAGTAALHEKAVTFRYKHGATYAARYLIGMRHRHIDGPDGAPLSLGERGAKAALRVLVALESDTELRDNPLALDTEIALWTDAINTTNDGLRQLYEQSLQPVAASV